MKCSIDELQAILSDIHTRLSVGDTFEGSITYSALDSDLQKGELRVRGGYRIGNSEGQGGWRMFNDD
jgi:hypothetical protein